MTEGTDDDPVLYDLRTETASGAIVEVFIHGDADPSLYPGGVKYRLHYGYPGDEHPIVRFDNRHGYHEIHEGPDTEEFEYEGPHDLYDRFLERVERHERELRDHD